MPFTRIDGSLRALCKNGKHRGALSRIRSDDDLFLLCADEDNVVWLTEKDKRPQ